MKCGNLALQLVGPEFYPPVLPTTDVGCSFFFLYFINFCNQVLMTYTDT